MAGSGYSGTGRGAAPAQLLTGENVRHTGFERRGLDMSDWRGVLGFWRRMTSRLSEGRPAAAAAAAPAPAAGTSTRGSSTEDPR